MDIPILFPAIDRNTNLLFSDATLHSHFYWEFTLFTSGTCKNTINGKELIVTENFLTILGPSHHHSIISITPTHTHRDIFIDSKQLQTICDSMFGKSFYQRLSDVDNPVVYKLPSHLVKSLDYSLSLLDAAYIQQNANESIEPVIRSIIVFILGQTFMKDNIHSEAHISWLTNQLTYLRQPEVFSQSTDDIIANSGYSHSQYLRKFKQATGIPLVKYLIDLRVTHAKMLLRSTTKSVLEISTEVGYDSINYFIRVFKSHTGVTPLQFRLQKEPKLLGDTHYADN